MRQIKTALLAGALALATTVAFAQVNVGGTAGTSGGAAIDTSRGGASGATDLNAGAGANVGAGGSKAGIHASGSSQLKTKKNQTTGSGSANGKMRLDTK